MIVTIDGPAGAGKSTVAKILAERMNYRFMPTGLLYRVLAYFVSKEVDYCNENEVERLLKTKYITVIQFDRYYTEGEWLNALEVWVDGTPIRIPLDDERFQMSEVSEAASVVSGYDHVRDFLSQVQLNNAKYGRVVAEGRDLGTVVSPDADCKFFLTATIEERARRRRESSDKDKSLEYYIEAMSKRDDREKSPLRPAVDAQVIDSTEMAIGEVVDIMAGTIRRHV